MSNRFLSYLAFFLCLIWVGIAVAEPAHPGRPHRWSEGFSAPGEFATGAAAGEGVLFLADREADVVAVIDLTTGGVTAVLPTPGYVPHGLAFDGTYLWIADAKDKLIHRMNPSDGTVTRSFDLPGGSVSGLAHDGTDLWVADPRSNELTKVSTVDGTAIVSIPAPAERTTGLTWDGAYLWAADRTEDEVYRVDPANGNVVLTLQAPGEHVWGLAWDGARLHVADVMVDQLFHLAPADLPPYALLEESTARISFHHEIRSHGPEMLQQVQISLAVPRERPGLELLSPVQFDPQPAEIGPDQWGQEFARFRFAAVPVPGHVGATMTFDARTHVVRYYLFPEQAGTLKQIPKELKKQYLVDGDKYRIEDPVIQAVVDEVAGSETNTYAIMRALYDHLLEHMFYDLDDGWNVAPTVLERGNGSCSEYTFVFIALCRAAGLPARYVGSVVRRYDDTAIDDVYHRWAEVYIPPYGWIPIDPSRGDKESAAQQAAAIGQLDNGLVITTESGGDSTDLGWAYNSASQVIFRGKAKVVQETYAEWEPIPETSPSPAPAPPTPAPAPAAAEAPPADATTE